MALVLSLLEGDDFNIGYRRFRLSAVRMPAGCIVLELGEGGHEVDLDKPIAVGDGVSLQEGIRQKSNVVRLMIVAPKNERIWRGKYEYDTTVALLAPVPEEHLISGQAMCSEVGRVSFGSRDFEVFRKLDEQREGAPCQVLVYASWPNVPPVGFPRITWTATYLRTVDARSDGSPPKGIFRPVSTKNYPGDKKGHWGVYWEVTDLQKCEGDQQLAISSLRGKNSAKNYLKTFHPERPMIIEAL
jgi:hypothetical protein